MKKILIVDDEKELRELLKETFEYRGFKCLTAKDGKEALEIANREIPSLIILDLIMPKLDGIETHKSLKASEATKHIPIIAYSAQPPEVVAKKGIESADIVDFIIKPFDVKDLIDSVVKAIGKGEEK